MARRGENIYHRRDGRWEGRYIVGRKPDGKPRFKSVYGKNYSEVKQRLTVLKAEHIQIGNKNLVLINEEFTMSDWMDFWLNVIEKPYIKETTYQLYKRNINKHLRPILGCIALNKLHKEEIQQTVDFLKEKLSSNTLHGVCRQLKSLLNHAVKNHLLVRSPYEDIRLPKFRKRSPRVLTVEEQRKLEKEVKNGKNLEYLFCLYTGVRLGELCALRYCDIDITRGVLCISHSVKRIYFEAESTTQLVIGCPKTESSVREIPLPNFLIQLLQERMKQSCALGSDFIFQNTMGCAAEPRTVQSKFARLTKKLGIRDAHMHTLRHTFAMRCLERGMGYKALSEILGHSSSKVTIEHYDNCTWESKARVMHSACLII